MKIEAVDSTHYSLALNPAALKQTAEKMAQEVIKLSNRKRKNKIPVLCYTGMSGVANATAVSLALNEIAPDFEFYMAYVRKENETSHGRKIEYSRPSENRDGEIWELPQNCFGVFIDDLIDTGRTEKYVREAILKEFKQIKAFNFVLAEEEF